MIEVAVIGAGSAGLVTAKNLVASGLRCCVFEAASTLGGAWSSPSSSGFALNEIHPTSEATAAMKSSPMWRGLRTNLSKHTCRFSDFPWPEDTPTFPSKEDMDWYLKSYANEFLFDEETDFEGNKEKGEINAGDCVPPCSFLYDCRVTRITPIGPGGVSSGEGDEQETGNNCGIHSDQRYRVEWTDSVAQTQHSKEFGGVVLATGFFSKPKYPSGLLPELQLRSNRNNDDDNSTADCRDPIQIIHSKDYSCHEQFATASTAVDEKLDRPQKFAIVGASHSALEIAVDLTKSAKEPVTVVMPRIPWVVPRYVPASRDGSGFLPIDLAFYRRTQAKEQGSTAAEARSEETTALTPESCRSKNEHLRALLGPRQDSILPVSKSSFDQPPMVAVSDLFLDLVQDGRIKVLNGRIKDLTEDGRGLRIARSNHNGCEEDEEVVVSDVTSLICCTGYSPDLESCVGNSAPEEDGSDESQQQDSPPLPNILETIRYDPSDIFSPMTTYLETLHPQLPNLAFVGMYRGPYMGVVELQARLASEHLSRTIPTNLSEEDFRAGLETSEAIRKQVPSLRPQFPRFDYVGFLDSLAGSLSSDPGFPADNRSTGDIVIPAFYQTDPTLVGAARSDLEAEIERGNSGHRLPGVVASALVGNWSFERNIVHFSNGGKTVTQRQYIHGTVNYSRSKDHQSVRYREDGFFEVAPNKSLPVFREYDYLCTGSDNDGGSGGALELFFVEGGKRANLFLSLEFKYQDKDGYWVATNDHLCIKDLYKANFRVKLDGLAATEAIITYRVRGPSKDYESTTSMKPR